MNKYKFTKKLCVFLGIFALVFVVTACGQAQQPPLESTQDNAVSDTSISVEDVQGITIGVLAPLTGPVAQFGVPVFQGLSLYIDAFNALGGLQINVEVYDEEGNPANAVIGYNWLVDQGMVALLGSVTSGATLAVVPFANEDNMPVISATSTHYNVTVNAETGEVWHNVFRASFIDPFQGEKMAEFAHEILQAQTAAILFNNEIDYSIGLTDTFYQRAIELGIEILIVEAFSDGNVDFLGQLTNIAALDPDVLFIPAYTQDVALIGPQSVQAGLDTILLGADGWTNAAYYLADPSSIEGAFFLSGFSVDYPDPIVQDFIYRYYNEFGTPPNMFAAQAYDAAMILVAALQLAVADGFAPGTDAFSDAVIAHMSATDLHAVTGHITFDSQNNPQKTAFIIQVVDGEEILWGSF